METQTMTHDEALRLREVTDYTYLMDDLAEKMNRQVKEKKSYVGADYGTAIAMAANLRAADAEVADTDPKSRRDFLDAFRKFTGEKANLDVAYRTVYSLLSVVTSKEEMYEWQIAPMSTQLEDLVVEIMRDKLEVVRKSGGQAYEKVAGEIESLLLQTDEGNEELMTEPLKIPKDIIEALEGMMTDADRAAAQRSQEGDIGKLEEAISQEDTA